MNYLVDLLSYNDMVSNPLGFFLSWLVMAIVLVVAWKLADRWARLGAQRKKIIGQFAAEKGMAMSPRSEYGDYLVQYWGRVNGRDVFLGTYGIGGKRSSEYLFAYAKCDIGSFQFSAEHNRLEMKGDAVKSGDSQFDRDFLSRTNDAQKSRQLLDTGITRKMSSLLQLTGANVASVFAGRNLWHSEPNVGDYVKRTMVEGRRFIAPLNQVPTSQGIAYAEFSLNSLKQTLDREQVASIFDLVLELAEKADKQVI